MWAIIDRGTTGHCEKNWGQKSFSASALSSSYGLACRLIILRNWVQDMTNESSFIYTSWQIRGGKNPSFFAIFLREYYPLA
jgi:hypothetical protein